MTTEVKGHNMPRDVFLYLLSIITLVASSISFGILVFQFINIYIPDIISDPYYSASSYLSAVRGAMATLIVVFPVFIWVLSFLKRDIERYPEKRDLRIRRWLLYLTLFAAALVIIGDTVALIINFLEGELSQRFLLKVLSILFIAGAVFVHYFSELKEKGKEFKWIRSFDWMVALVVVAGIIGGFFVVGSPQSQRLVRLDERKTSDLQNIQWQIINYWQKKEALPAQLTDLNDPIAGFMVPRDPQTGELYEYRVTGDLKFELCAEFNTEGSTDLGTAPRLPVEVYEEKGIDGRNVWSHKKGRDCFERTIDPQLYPPNSLNPKF